MNFFQKNYKKISSGKWVKWNKEKSSFWTLKNSIKWRRFPMKLRVIKSSNRNCLEYLSRSKNNNKSMVLKLHMPTPSIIKHLSNWKSKILKYKICREIIKRFRISVNINKIFMRQLGPIETYIQKISSSQRMK